MPATDPSPASSGARTARCALVAAIALLWCAPRAATALGSPVAERPVCVYVSSYHRGYSWSDRLENGLRERVGELCRLVRYDLDSKRRRASRDIRAAAARALDGIRTLDADVVLVSDDNALKYLVRPHLLGGDVPVVFAGANWTVEEYGLPAPNVTGIVEVAPIGPMLRQAVSAVPGARRAAYLGARTLTETKNFERIRKSAESLDIELEPMYAADLDEWRRAFDRAQEHDFVVLGSASGVDGWDAARARAHALAATRRPAFTNHDWMMPFASVGYTKIPEEQGEWAGASALAILDGLDPDAIPLVTNRKWDVWINPSLLGATGVRLPASLLRRAKRAGDGS